MKKKKIIVTGGAGFIGSHTVVELIQSGYDPIVVDNFENSFQISIEGIEKITGQKITVYSYDIKNEKALSGVFKSEGEIDAVIHFAANKAVGESSKDPLKYYKNNLLGLIVLLEEMRNADIRKLVFSSSCTVYGIPDSLPVNENLKTQRPASPYGNTKKIGEEIIEDFQAANPDFSCISLRYFNPIGAHPSAEIGELPIGVPNNLVPFITQTAAGLRKELTVFGNDYDTPDGTCIRDYIHVVDLAKAHVQSLGYFDKMDGVGKNEIFNLGTGKGNTVLEVIQTFEKVSGEKLPYRIGPRREGDVPAIFGEVNKANSLLGWETNLSLEEALIDAWKWQKHLAELNLKLS